MSNSLSYIRTICFAIVAMLCCSKLGFGQSNPKDQNLETLIDRLSVVVDEQNLDSARALLQTIKPMLNDSTEDRLRAKLLFEDGKMGLSTIGPVDRPTRNLLESLSLYTKLQDSLGIAKCNLQLGVAAYDIENYSDAVEYIKNSKEYTVPGDFRIGLCNYLLALCYSELGMFKEAELMFDLAEDQVGRSSDIFWLQIQGFRGSMYINRGDYDLAVDHLNKLLRSNLDLVEREEYAPIYSFLCKGYYKQGDYKNAIITGMKARSFSIGDGAQMIYYRKAIEFLHQAYAAIGQEDSAYIFLQELSNIKDSVSNSQILQRVAELKGEHEFQIMINQQRAEQDLKDAIAKQQLEQTRLTRNFVGGGLILALFVALIFFRQRNNLSREKARSDELLLNILPREIAQELKDHGKAKARKFENAAILFTDFKEFTSTSEKLTPEELVDEINTCFEAFDNISDKYGIEKIKTIGDAYMAVGGLPELKPDSVKRTVLAALGMQKFIEERYQTKKEKGEQAFRMRIGINTGPVVAGIVGKKKFQYDIWGDTVNTASRVESMCEIGKVNISRSTYDIIHHDMDFTFQSRGPMAVKGKGMMEMFFVSLELREG